MPWGSEKVMGRRINTADGKEKGKQKRETKTGQWNNREGDRKMGREKKGREIERRGT